VELLVMPRGERKATMFGMLGDLTKAVVGVVVETPPAV